MFVYGDENQFFKKSVIKNDFRWDAQNNFLFKFLDLIFRFLYFLFLKYVINKCILLLFLKKINAYGGF